MLDLPTEASVGILYLGKNFNTMKLFLLSIFFIASSCATHQPSTAKIEISSTLDKWHRAAANADFSSYFNLMTSDAIYIGTDATENWNVQQFKAFAKPYFDRGKAWSFFAVQRNIYVVDANLAYFDELLDTQMKICRGSGIMKKIDNQWKVQHYVLSMTVPNENAAAVTAIKTPVEDALLKSLKPAPTK